MWCRRVLDSADGRLLTSCYDPCPCGRRDGGGEPMPHYRCHGWQVLPEEVRGMAGKIPEGIRYTQF